MNTLGSCNADRALMLGYIDGAFPDEKWSPYYMKNLFLYPRYPHKYFLGFLKGKHHRYLRWMNGQENDPF